MAEAHVERTPRHKNIHSMTTLADDELSCDGWMKLPRSAFPFSGTKSLVPDRRDLRLRIPAPASKSPCCSCCSCCSCCTFLGQSRSKYEALRGMYLLSRQRDAEWTSRLGLFLAFLISKHTPASLSPISFCPQLEVIWKIDLRYVFSFAFWAKCSSSWCHFLVYRLSRNRRGL
jgi:hypothetical protein